MIRVHQLSKKFNGITAVDEVSFEVQERETLILLGTSGCGKTTTLKMLNRLIEPTSGSIEINGKDVKQQSVEELRRGMGYVLQNTGLFPHYTVAENVGLVPALLNWSKARIDARASELMEKLHLPLTLLNAYPKQLSGGQQQRVGLARALAADPPVLLMDEPFGALDNVTRTKIQTEFKQLDELTRKAIIMVTHDVQEAFELGDRIALMDKGQIVQLATPKELLYNPGNNFVRDFLKGQRLQLELRSVLLQDLWDQLPAQSAAFNTTVPATTSVWQAMELFKANTVLAVNDIINNDSKSIGFEQLMAAFHEHKHNTSA